jgi:hypothetical protein
MRTIQHNASGRGVEVLERRLLMNGNVAVSFTRGDLAVTGDGADNYLEIARLNSRTLRVEGKEGTRINGRAFADFSGALDDVRVNLRQGGEDKAEIQGPLNIGGNLSGQFGDGEFAVEGSAGAVVVAGNVSIVSTGEGDVALRNELRVSGNTSVRTATGSASAAAALGIVPDFAAARFSNPLDIDNPYFPLVVGTKYTYEERSVDEETGEVDVETVVVEVTNQTKTILGVVNRVLRDRVFVDGLLVEDTKDWHSQDDSGNVWYFGEESTDFEYDDEGNLISSTTEASWEAGVDGAKPGIIMQARPRVGDGYYQEFYPGVALDQGKVLATKERATVPGGGFSNVVRTKDTTVLSPGGLEHKLYAPGLGLIQEFSIDLQSGETDGVLRLLSAERNGKRVTRVVNPNGFSGVNATGKGTGPLRLRGETLIRAEGPVVLLETRLYDEVEIFGESEVSVVDSVLEDLTIEAGSSVGLRNVTATEEILIEADGDTFIFNSRLRDDVEIMLGGGDDELVIGRSNIGDLDADGGRGENTFDDRVGNSIGELELTRFEEE